MKEIVVVSGKGGTGKTSITAAFAFLGAADIVAADCDVDAADMHLLLRPVPRLTEDFSSGELALINEALCTRCGKCAQICRYGAISNSDGPYKVDTLDCEGCGYCARICPAQAITMNSRNVGVWYISETRIGCTMVHARLGIGAENSGKLVAKVKEEAKRTAGEAGKKYILVDGSPGIGCPVVSSLSGADFVVLVTEPTVSGIHDLKRVYSVVKNFKIPAGCIINKADLNGGVEKEILDYMKGENIVHLASLPYDEAFTKAMVEGLTIVEYTGGAVNEALAESWRLVRQALE
jgi:MinD superfamily P-loop ATPase